MGRRKSELAALDRLTRNVWGDTTYRAYSEARAARTARRARIRDVTSIALGVPLIAAAAVLVVLPTAAYAHTSAIDISCTEVAFHYQTFSDGFTTAHEVIAVDGVDRVARDFVVTTPDVSDLVALDLGAGTHVVRANNSWTASDGPGSAQAQQTFSDCHPGVTSSTTGTTVSPPTGPSTTAVATSSTSPPSTAVSTTTAASTTTVPGSTPSTPTTGGSTTTVTTPVTGQGSTAPTTSTTSPSSISTVSPPTSGPPPSPLPFTGSDNKPPAIALGLVGSGLVAMGIGGRRRPSKTR